MLNTTTSVVINDNYTLPEDLTFGNGDIDTVNQYDIEDVNNAGLNIIVTDTRTAGMYQATSGNTVLYSFALYCELVHSFITACIFNKFRGVRVTCTCTDNYTSVISCTYRWPRARIFYTKYSSSQWVR